MREPNAPSEDEAPRQNEPPDGPAEELFFAFLSVFRIGWSLTCSFIMVAGLIGLFTAKNVEPTWIIVTVAAVIALPVGLLFIRFVWHRLERASSDRHGAP